MLEDQNVTYELGTTHDWSVILRESGEQGEWTVVTDRRAEWDGHRVVRGREAECAAYHERLSRSELPFE